MATTPSICTPCIAYRNMQVRWTLIDDLLGGTIAMQAAGIRWLPKEPKERDDKYKVRLYRSHLYNGYKDTTQKLVSKPFSKPMTLNGKLPESLALIQRNADRAGTNLHDFLKSCFEEAVHKGKTHVITDYPKIPDGQKPSIADEKASGARAYFVHVKPCDLIGWKSHVDEMGETVLDEVRIKEVRVEEEKNWEEKKVTYVRAWYPDRWELYKTEEGKDDVFVSGGKHSFGRIPLRTLYFNRTAFMEADPCMEDLAWVNLTHWQSNSDQRNILRIARVAILALFGFSKDDLKETGGEVVVGPNNVLKTSKGPQEADAKYVEHTGKSIEAGEKDLERLKEEMEALGMQPLMKRLASSSATGVAVDEARTATEIQAWIMATEIFAKEILEDAAEWRNEELDEDVKVQLFSEFSLTMRAADETATLMAMRKQGDLSRKTLLQEVKRRDIISENVDVDEEITRIEEEGPPLGSLGQLTVDPNAPAPQPPVNPPVKKPAPKK